MFFLEDGCELLGIGITQPIKLASATLLYLGELQREILAALFTKCLFQQASCIFRTTLNDESLGSSLLLIFLEDLLRQVRRDSIEGCEFGRDLLHVGRRELAADDSGRFLAYHRQQNCCFSWTTQGGFGAGSAHWLLRSLT